MLNEDFKIAWLEALRSGKYAQTTGALRVTPGEAEGYEDDLRKVGYCCLGVGCMVTKDLDPAIPVEEQLECADMPTPRVMKFWGLDQMTAERLSQMNDDDGEEWGFEEIADWIEKNL
jgi:hypothetical protein